VRYERKSFDIFFLYMAEFKNAEKPCRNKQSPLSLSVCYLKVILLAFMFCLLRFVWNIASFILRPISYYGYLFRLTARMLIDSLA